MWSTLRRHWVRALVTLIPVVFALLHVVGALHLDVLKRLDDIIFDARLRATLPGGLDPQIVIVDIDEKSLSEVGRWPWNRKVMANLLDELFGRQEIGLVGFDVIFAEADASSGLDSLKALAEGSLRNDPRFAREVKRLHDELDYDGRMAQALTNRPVVLSYYFSSDRGGTKSGVLPQPAMRTEDLQGRQIGYTTWNGYGANIERLAKAAPTAGFVNPITDGDGVVRSLPVLAEHDGAFYESLSLAMFRMLLDRPDVLPGFAKETVAGSQYVPLESILLRQGDSELAVPVDQRLATLVPFRGPGGQQGGSFRYVSASDLIFQRLEPGELAGKVVLVGTTAPGMFDLRTTPVGENYPGVEIHANLISGLMEGRLLVRPDYAVGFEFLQVVAAGLVLVLLLPILSAQRAVALALVVLAVLVGFNFWLFQGRGLVLPLATAVAMVVTSFALNMSYGYFVESRSKRELANLFGTYVPPELVDEMVRNPDSYSMKAANRELTVMFCDMRGFTKMSELMEPTKLQELLNGVFSRLTQIIRAQRGTIDKYMGDCVMAFWGAPVDTPNHAELATATALAMAQEVERINQEHRSRGLPEIGVGIGLNTGVMCVGDMGSDLRRSYTVIGDAVNLGSRLEGLSKVYGVQIVASQSTRDAAGQTTWRELDLVRVKGKEQAVAIYEPLAKSALQAPGAVQENAHWGAFLLAYRQQRWADADVQLTRARLARADSALYALYRERLQERQAAPPDPNWDGATNFETK